MARGILAVNVGIYLLLAWLAPESYENVLRQTLLLHPEGAWGHPWQLATALFCHEEILHLLFNLSFFWWIGSELEDLYGSHKLLILYLLSGIAGNLAYLAAARHQLLPQPALGASGAVLGCLLVHTLHHPRQEVSLWGLVRIQLRALAVLYVLLDVSGVFHTGSRIETSAHLGGAGFGLLWALFEKRRF